MSYQRSVWSGGVGAIAALPKSEPTRYGRVAVRGSLGAVTLAASGGGGSATARTLTALEAAAVAANAAAMRAKAVYDAANRALHAVWIPGKNDNAPTIRDLRRKMEFALLAFRAAVYKAAQANAAVVAMRKQISIEPGVFLRGNAVSRIAAIRASRPPVVPYGGGSAGGGSGGSSGGSAGGGSAGGGSAGGGSAGGGSGGGGSGGGDPGVAPDAAPPDTGPPIDMPPEAPGKKPMPTIAKVGITAAVGYVLYSMFT